MFSYRYSNCNNSSRNWPTVNVADNRQQHESLTLLADLNEHLVTVTDDEFQRNLLIQRNVSIYRIISKMEKKIKEVEDFNRVIDAHVASWHEYEVSFVQEIFLIKSSVRIF